MPDFITIGKIAGAITALIGLLVMMLHGLKRLRVGIKKLIDALEKLDLIKKEVTPNGGGSMKDLLAAQAKLQQKVSSDISGMKDQLDAMSLRQRLTHDASGVGSFEASPSGLWTFASPTHCRTVGMALEDLLGMGWLNTICTEDREAVREEWQSCFEDVRAFDKEVCVAAPDGGCFASKMIVRPLRGADGSVRLWQGLITYNRRACDIHGTAPMRRAGHGDN
jgi:PAS domain S-box-containing protein